MKYSKKGFTLVELIVVIAILAIISAIAIPTTIAYIGDAERNTASSNANTVLRQIQNNINDIRGAENYTDTNLVKILNTYSANPGEGVVGVTVTIDGVITVYTNVEYNGDSGLTGVAGYPDLGTGTAEQVVAAVYDTNVQLDTVDGPIKAKFTQDGWVDA